MRTRLNTGRGRTFVDRQTIPVGWFEINWEASRRCGQVTRTSLHLGSGESRRTHTGRAALLLLLLFFPKLQQQNNNNLLTFILFLVYYIFLLLLCIVLKALPLLI